MDWLVTGAGGMLGRDVLARLAGERRRPRSPAGPRRPSTSPTAAAVRAAFGDHRPAVVVNCAAWTAVDDAETREADGAARSTATGPRRPRRGLRRAPAPCCSTSPPTTSSPATPTTPYAEDAPTGPRTAYGRTKLAGEQAVLDDPPGHRLRRPHRLAVRRGRPQLRPYDDPAGGRRGRPSTWSTTSAASPPGPPTWPTGCVRLGHGRPGRHRPGGRLPRHQRRRDDLVRLRPGDLPAARRRPGRGSAPPPATPSSGPRPAPGVQRARPRPLGGGRHRADPGLARGAGRGVPGPAGGGTAQHAGDRALGALLNSAGGRPYPARSRAAQSRARSSA